MLLIFRLVFKLFMANFRPKIRVFDDSSIQLRVLPTDSEFKVLNSGRYVQLTELAGAERNFRCGLLQKMIKRKWWVVAVAQRVHHIRRIKLFQKFILNSRMLGWDDTFFYWEWTFYRGKDLAAVAYTKCAIRSRDGAVTSKAICDLMGEDHAARPIDPVIQAALELPTKFSRD